MRRLGIEKQHLVAFFVGVFLILLLGGVFSPQFFAMVGLTIAVALLFGSVVLLVVIESRSFQHLDTMGLWKVYFGCSFASIVIAVILCHNSDRSSEMHFTAALVGGLTSIVMGLVVLHLIAKFLDKSGAWPNDS